MAPSPDSPFPTVKGIARINSLDKKHEDTQFFDCQFYPYTLPGVDPVFAIVGKGETIVCRPGKTDETQVEVQRWFKDEDRNTSLNSCTWSQDLATGDPLLCVTGQPPSIKIFNVRTGELDRTLIGHGKEINDLAVSPLSPAILASASMDYTVRFWSLNPKHAHQPCMLICGGEGHKEGLLTLAFHPTGRYLLTGGMDCVVNLWTIPDLPNDVTGSDKPTIIHYPHFSTSEIHTDFVDCVSFYNDLILSKCANENKILLWRIENFSSTSPPHPPSTAPTTHDFRPTRSAFGGTYQRLLQFEAVETTPFYMRFSLFAPPGRHPILCIGNEKSKVFFWDLQALEEWDGVEPPERGGRFKLPRNLAKKGVARKIVKGVGGGGIGHMNGNRELSIASEGTATTNSHSTLFLNERPTPNRTATPAEYGNGYEGVGDVWGGLGLGTPTLSRPALLEDIAPSRARLKFSTDDPFRALLPHRTHVVPRVTFAARQVAWSVGGEWMVVVGDQGMVAVFEGRGV
ncbi:hypothetical protein MMC30_008630 [Trapelia coarctata]|nr:hypothetical protein [Trapelia coarctata]